MVSRWQGDWKKVLHCVWVLTLGLWALALPACHKQSATFSEEEVLSTVGAELASANGGSKVMNFLCNPKVQKSILIAGSAINAFRIICTNVGAGVDYMASLNGKELKATGTYAPLVAKVNTGRMAVTGGEFQTPDNKRFQVVIADFLNERNGSAETKKVFVTPIDSQPAAPPGERPRAPLNTRALANLFQKRTGYVALSKEHAARLSRLKAVPLAGGGKKVRIAFGGKEYTVAEDILKSAGVNLDDVQIVTVQAMDGKQIALVSVTEPRRVDILDSSSKQVAEMNLEDYVALKAIEVTPG